MGMKEIVIHDDATTFIAENCLHCKVREDMKQLQGGKEYWQRLYCPQMDIINYKGKAWYPQYCPNFVKRPPTEEELAELNKTFDEVFGDESTDDI